MNRERGAMRRSSYGWREYVPVAARRHQAASKIARMRKAGHKIAPVRVSGRKIAMTFWGDAWCQNLEAYSDYSNRLPRGRTYVRNGSVIDLQVEAGRVGALVSGSEIYEVTINITPLTKRRWRDVKGKCAGQIGSLVELLGGSISRGVMEVVTRQGEGLFPSPREISLSCSCPDWATMCKHVAATLYGVGARLDQEPKLLFALRGVDPTEMVEAAVDQAPTGSRARRGRVLESDELSAVFGVDIDMGEAPASARPTRKKATKKSATRKTARNKKAASKKATVKKTTARKTKARKATAKKAATRKASPRRKATPAKKAGKRTNKKVRAR